MKTPSEMVKSLYLGDRACKQVIIDGWRRRLLIQVDKISRIRDPSGRWDFYGDEDIIDGMIVFEGVSFLEFAPPGPVPSDWIEFLNIDENRESSPVEGHFRARLSLGAVDEDGSAKEVTLTVQAASLHLEDPGRPGVKIED